MPGLGFIDTANGPQDFANPDYGALTKLSNQYAAMPSLHIGWSLWCGVVIAIVAPKLWMKLLGMVYPLLTFSVIVGTANHYVLDALGGATAVGLGFGLQYVLTGPGRQALGRMGKSGEGAAEGDRVAPAASGAGARTPETAAGAVKATAPPGPAPARGPETDGDPEPVGAGEEDHKAKA